MFQGQWQSGSLKLASSVSSVGKETRLNAKESESDEDSRFPS